MLFRGGISSRAKFLADEIQGKKFKINTSVSDPQWIYADPDPVCKQILNTAFNCTET
jgi:hypothetical protein